FPYRLYDRFAITLSPLLPSFFLCSLPHLVCSPLFPYTTLFRSPRPRGRTVGDDRLERAAQRECLEHRAHRVPRLEHFPAVHATEDRKSTRLNSSHVKNSYAVFCVKIKKTEA